MRRHLVVLLSIGLVLGALSPAEGAKKRPRPVDVTYDVVWDRDRCVLSTSAMLANEAEGCLDPFAGSITGPYLGTGPFVIPAIDGLPLRLDASKTIRGTIYMDSFVASNAAPVPTGVGQAEVDVVVTATSGGAELTLGEATATYLVTPQTADYEFEFEISPAIELTGKVLDSLTLSVEVTGPTLFHGAIEADGTSTLTVGALSAPR